MEKYDFEELKKLPKIVTTEGRLEDALFPSVCRVAESFYSLNKRIRLGIILFHENRPGLHNVVRLNEKGMEELHRIYKRKDLDTFLKDRQMIVWTKREYFLGQITKAISPLE